MTINPVEVSDCGVASSANLSNPVAVDSKGWSAVAVDLNVNGTVVVNETVAGSVVTPDGVDVMQVDPMQVDVIAASRTQSRASFIASDPSLVVNHLARYQTWMTNLKKVFEKPTTGDITLAKELYLCGILTNNPAVVRKCLDGIPWEHIKDTFEEDCVLACKLPDPSGLEIVRSLYNTYSVKTFTTFDPKATVPIVFRLGLETACRFGRTMNAQQLIGWKRRDYPKEWIEGAMAIAIANNQQACVTLLHKFSDVVFGEDFFHLEVVGNQIQLSGFKVTIPETVVITPTLALFLADTFTTFDMNKYISLAAPFISLENIEPILARLDPMKVLGPICTHERFDILDRFRLVNTTVTDDQVDLYLTQEFKDRRLNKKLDNWILETVKIAWTCLSSELKNESSRPFGEIILEALQPKREEIKTIFNARIV